MFRELRVAVGFLTILPVSPKRIEPADMGGAVAFFPLVGVIFAITIWGLLKLFNLIFSATIAAWVGVLSIVVLNGAIHWDGFADTADGLGGRTPEQSRMIMKDSRLGAFGGMALIFLISGKIIALASLINLPVNLFVCIFGLSRWAMAFQIYTQSSVSEGLLKGFHIKNRRIGLLISGGLSLIMVIGAFPISVLLTTLTLLVLFIMNRIVKRKFGGITGDILGATNELIELICLFALNISKS